MVAERLMARGSGLSSFSGGPSSAHAIVIRCRSFDAAVDAAIVIAPMSGRLDALRRCPDHTVRSAFARRLRAEARQLADAGIDVHIFEPDAATLPVLGINPIDRTRTARVVPTRSSLREVRSLPHSRPCCRPPATSRVETGSAISSVSGLPRCGG
jgi:hypothetical protein